MHSWETNLGRGESVELLNSCFFWKSWHIQALSKKKQDWEPEDNNMHAKIPSQCSWKTSFNLFLRRMDETYIESGKNWTSIISTMDAGNPYYFSMPLCQQTQRRVHWPVSNCSSSSAVWWAQHFTLFVFTKYATNKKICVSWGRLLYCFCWRKSRGFSTHRRLKWLHSSGVQLMSRQTSILTWYFFLFHLLNIKVYWFYSNPNC